MWLPLTALVFSIPVLQRWSFKSVALFFLPLIFVVNSDVIRPDLRRINRLRELRRDFVSKLKIGWAVVTIVFVLGGLLVKNFAARLYEVGEENLSVLGRALCEYFVPRGIVEVKVWQMASAVNALLFLYTFFVFVPRAIRRWDNSMDPPARWHRDTKTFLYWADVVSISLSLYSLACGLAIILIYVTTHEFPPKHFQFFPSAGPPGDGL